MLHGHSIQLQATFALPNSALENDRHDDIKLRVCIPEDTNRIVES